MTAIVHKHYQPRSVADEFFAQAYPGYRLVAYQANSTSERLSLKLEPINYPICPKCGQQCPKIHATLHREVRCAPQHGFTEVFLSCLCDVSVAISAVLELWRTLHGYARNLV